MKIVQVFRTDVQDKQAAARIILFLQRNYSHCSINFDLDDCDNILRIENPQGPVTETIVQLVLAGYGYDCEPLSD